VVILSDAPHMRPVDISMTSTDGCARDVMAVTRMRFVQEAELGRAAPTRIRKSDGCAERIRLLTPTPRQKLPEISPIFNADTVRLPVFAGKGR
jgi:hypothetical protein